jgi:hypothetical protein
MPEDPLLRNAAAKTAMNENGENLGGGSGGLDASAGRWLIPQYQQQAYETRGDNNAVANYHHQESDQRQQHEERRDDYYYDDPYGPPGLVSSHSKSTTKTDN